MEEDKVVVDGQGEEDDDDDDEKEEKEEEKTQHILFDYFKDDNVKFK